MSGAEKNYVQLGPRRWLLGGPHLKILEPNNDCLTMPNVADALRNQLDEKGYIYLQNFLPKEDVLKAKMAVLEYLHQLNMSGAWATPIFSSSYLDGILATGCDVGCIPCMEGSNTITNHPAVFHIIEHPRLYDLFTSLFHGIHPLTFDYKWLRGMHHGGNTGCHLDRVYMNRGSSELLTCWIPLDNLTLDMSVLAILENSHRTDGSVNSFYTKLQQTYANLDVERDNLQGTGWFTEDPMEFYNFHQKEQEKDSEPLDGCSTNPIWKTTAFSAGDILIFTMRTVHMSSVNLTEKIRLSCDTRWQPSNQPVDPRFVHLNEKLLTGHENAKFGIHAKNAAAADNDKTTIEQWRIKWGFPFEIHN